MSPFRKYLVDLRGMAIVCLIGGLIFWYGYGWVKGVLFAMSLLAIMHLPLAVHILVKPRRN